MITIKEVTTKKQRKEFVNFPLKLYKKNPYFVPPLYAEEMKIFTKRNAYHQYAKSSFFLAYLNNKVVGRISGIIQKQSNEKMNEKRARFTRFDAIDNQDVANALFKAVEDWAKEKGMNIVCGPLGYSDLEREGLLIEGFEELSTFEEQYNYDYYPRLIERAGYKKEIDWFEYKLYPPLGVNPKLDRVADAAFSRLNLHIGTAKNKRAYIKKYQDGIFHCLDEGYKKLYGTVPFTTETKKQIVDQFILFINLKYVMTICDSEGRVVAFGLSFPSIGPALQKSGGRLTPSTLIRLFKILRNPKVVDLGLIAVLPEYQNLGVNAIILRHLSQWLIRENILYCETNLNLENNVKVQEQWKYFPHELHKKRRSYLKKI